MIGKVTKNWGILLQKICRNLGWCKKWL